MKHSPSKHYGDGIQRTCVDLRSWLLVISLLVSPAFQLSTRASCILASCIFPCLSLRCIGVYIHSLVLLHWTSLLPSLDICFELKYTLITALQPLLNLTLVILINLTGKREWLPPPTTFNWLKEGAAFLTKSISQISIYTTARTLVRICLLIKPSAACGILCLHNAPRL